MAEGPSHFARAQKQQRQPGQDGKEPGEPKRRHAASSAYDGTSNFEDGEYGRSVDRCAAGVRGSAAKRDASSALKIESSLWMADMRNEVHSSLLTAGGTWVRQMIKEGKKFEKVQVLDLRNAYTAALSKSFSHESFVELARVAQAMLAAGGNITVEVAGKAVMVEASEFARLEPANPTTEVNMLVGDGSDGTE
ncbi:hypothetical protein AK812_SmicGene41431 [Symbiodinium microadriaticum]|uniref:Uncharacterized protein n=1 Tax=Symbiodinium microadriaticum TaxID=2951 RepID=A0A1Q9C688_SYMMI|nr:hypothetical protein AK812_SmicGene41431 [Symbiodinium microadriaticum]